MHSRYGTLGLLGRAVNKTKTQSLTKKMFLDWVGQGQGSGSVRAACLLVLLGGLVSSLGRRAWGRVRVCMYMTYAHAYT